LLGRRERYATTTQKKDGGTTATNVNELNATADEHWEEKVSPIFSRRTRPIIGVWSVRYAHCSFFIALRLACGRFVSRPVIVV
jgi:hypothetical protein